MDKESRAKKVGKTFRAEGIALAIPMVMATFPLVGAGAGYWLAKYFEKPWILWVGVFVGLLLAIREVTKLVKMLNKVPK